MRQVLARALRDTRLWVAGAVGSRVGHRLRGVGGAVGYVPRAARAARRQVRADLRADPYLGYILVFSAVLSAFWVWHRLPNFATRDERWRVVDPIEAVAALDTELSYESLRDGVTYWRSYGATFYVAALVVLPVLAAAVSAGELAAFLEMGRHLGTDFWTHWLRTPGWLWTASVLLARLVVVGCAVGSVYLSYRIGTLARDRATGRLTALLLSVTWGFLVLAHEAGEDVPALFLFLLAFYLALRYVDSGAPAHLYASSVVGGFASAVKLNAGVVSLVIGAAFLSRALEADGPLAERLVRPRVLLTGVGLGVAAILLGYPSVPVGEPAHAGGRVTRGVANKAQPHGWRVRPSWWWVLRGYLHGLGLPLAVASAGGVLASLAALGERSREATAIRLALLATAVLLAVYSQWAYVRTHHLLLTFPLVALVVAVMAGRLRERRPSLGRVLVALLLVTSGLYAVGGDLAYADQPRDRSAAWLSEHAGANATVETYVRDPQEAGVPHDATISHVGNRTMTVDDLTYSPGVRRWTLMMPYRCPDYIVLNYHQSLQYLAPDDWGTRASRLSNPDLEDYFRDLLAEDTFPYEVARTFGRRPRFLDGRGRRPTWRALIRVGLRPRTIQYGDPQDLGVDQYTVVLERTGDCSPVERSV